MEKKDRQRGLEQKSGGSSPKYGPAFYDEPAVFARYQAKRVGSSNANETLEKPIFDELAGDLQNLRILDLGCGDARFGLEALECGCRSYLGIEGSSNMFQLSQKNLAGTQGKVVYAAMEAWAYPESQFDLVVSCLALHYIEDITAMFAKIFKTLAPGGRLIFSVKHPVITSSSRSRPAGELRQDWTVDDFFWTGRRVTSWMGGKVIKFHRTVEDYFLALQDAGFQVDALRESRPKREIFEKFEDEVTYRRRMRIPLMLFFAARKPDADAFC